MSSTFLYSFVYELTCWRPGYMFLEYISEVNNVINDSTFIDIFMFEKVEI
jgi:hypothetical protein